MEIERANQRHNFGVLSQPGDQLRLTLQPAPNPWRFKP
jgi:hypothetical protein